MQGLYTIYKLGCTSKHVFAPKYVVSHGEQGSLNSMERPTISDIFWLSKTNMIFAISTIDSQLVHIYPLVI